MSGIPGVGGGSNSGSSATDTAAARQAAEKQTARNAVNAAFGVAPSMDDITSGALGVKSGGHGFDPLSGQVTGGPIGTGSTIFNPAGGLFGSSHTVGGSTNYDDYNNSVADYNKELTDAAANKTARDSLYDTVRQDAFNAGTTSLDDAKTSASRNNKFALFAQGLNGGSQDVDESALLGRTYNQGLLDLGAKADAAKAGLQSSDEQARLALLSDVDNGMSTSDALTSAASQLKSASDSAEANAQGTNLGDLFGSAGLLYTKSNAARGGAAAQTYLASLFPQAAMLSGGRGGGIVTSTG